MNKHILSLEIPLVANTEIMSIIDTSQYASNLNVDCGELLITAPGYNRPVLIKLNPNFKLNLNACLVGVQTKGCGETRVDIPDGIYIIKYSVSPTNKVNVEYNHLRITSLLKLYYETLCHIDVKDCEPHSTRKDLIDEMGYIKTLIDAALSKVHYCNSPKEGMDLYEYAKKRLLKISCRYTNC